MHMIRKIFLAVGVLAGALALSPLDTASGDGVNPLTLSPQLAALPPLHFRLPPDINGKSLRSRRYRPPITLPLPSLARFKQPRLSP